MLFSTRGNTLANNDQGYRANLETFNKVRLRPRVLQDVVGVENTLNTTILGYNFSAPFFISPAARAGLGHPDAEINLVKGAAAGGILYIVRIAFVQTIIDRLTIFISLLYLQP